MLQTWRWFGPADPVSLRDARQAGVGGIVTALHHLYDGRAWTADDIAERKGLLKAEGFEWSVCEWIPVHTSIKLRDGSCSRYVDAWKDSLANLGRAGTTVVCYNFMPVVDWTRTDLLFPTTAGGLALRFDMVDFVAYDVHVLKRAGADADYSASLLEQAERRFAGMDQALIDKLEHNIIAGLPGGEATYNREAIRKRLAAFAGIGPEELRANLIEFLKEVVPVAEEVGTRLAIHPDDPPFSLFGLPRIVSTAADARLIIESVDSIVNGLTLCAGSYGSRRDNDVVALADEFGPRIHFTHLRNVNCEPDGSSWSPSISAVTSIW